MPVFARAGVLVATLALLSHGEALAKKKKANAGNQHVVALFVVAKDKPNPKIYAALMQELTKAPKALPTLRLLFGKPLKRLIKVKPDAAISKCGSDIECVAKLGSKARADEVVYGRVVPSDSGVKVQFLIVNVASVAIDRKVSFDFDGVASVAQVREQYAELFGRAGAAEPPAVAASEDSGDDDELSLDMIEGSPLGQADATPAGDALAAVEPTPAAPAGDPTAEAPATSDDLDLTAPPSAPPPSELAAVSPEAVEASSVSSERSRLLFYAGVGLAGVGVAGVGAGAFFGNKAKSLRGDLDSNTTQVAGQDLEADANSAAKRANLMFGVGGLALAAGAGLVVYDFMVSKSGEGSTDVSVGATGTGAFLQWSW